MLAWLRMRARSLAVASITLFAGAACGGKDPADAVRAFDRAAEAGARDQVYQLLGPATRARLEADARRASELSGRRGVRPEELLAIGWSPRRFRTASVRVLGRAGDHAEVEVIGERGERERLQLVLVPDGWRIELP
jgi:hypothetical protein